MRDRRILILGAVVLFLLVPPAWGAEKKADAPTGKVTGRISCETECSGVASLWDARVAPPDPRRYIIIPAAVTSLRPDGTFELQALPGRYFLGAVVKNGEIRATGPPVPGDRIFMSPDAAGNFKMVEVRAGETIDVGISGKGWIYEGLSADAGTSIAGRVTDVEGESVPGLLVFAFLNEEMSGLPLAVSQRTGPGGEFLLRLPHPGTVYLRVMENYGGGRPAEGGYMGVYGGREPAPVTIAENQKVRNVAIEVLRLPAMKRPEPVRTGPGENERGGGRRGGGPAL